MGFKQRERANNVAMSDQPTVAKVLEKRQDASRRKLRMLFIVVLLVAMGFVAGDWFSPKAGFLKTLVYGAGGIHITSDPSGAEVLVDGIVIGVTPFRLDAMLSGKYTLQVRHPYHPPHIEPLLIERGSSHRFAINFQPAYGSLSLASNPVGATVKLDGELLTQVTPMQLPQLQAGNHQVVFSIFGRKVIEREIEVLPGASENLVVELNRTDSSALTVNTHPSWATVNLLHIPVKYEPGVRVPTGEYLIEVRASGYESQTRNEKLRVGINVIDITLKRVNAELNVVTTPADTRIVVRVGRDVNSRVYTKNMVLPTGPIEVLVQKKGYRTIVKRIDLSPSGRYLKLTLERINVVIGQRIRDAFRDGSGHAPEVVVIGDGSAARPGGRGYVNITDPFAIGVAEVTVGEYRVFAAATGGETPVVKGADSDEHPIAKISWSNAVAYTQWLTKQTGNRYRLPSETEWAYVAYSGSIEGAVCERGNVADQSLGKIFRKWETEACDDGHVRLAPVRSFAPNSLGVYDLTGNVSEWVQDCGRTGCDSHVIRGSAWDTTDDVSGLEYSGSSFDPGDTRGMRIVREL